MGVNSLPKTVTRQRRDCDLSPGPTAPESSTLTTRLPSHPAESCSPIYQQSTQANKRRITRSHEPSSMLYFRTKKRQEG